MMEFGALFPRDGDALIVVDVQNDFLRGGSRPARSGESVITALNRYISLFASGRLPVVAVRDWHPPDHCSFADFGGDLPAHCVAGSPGAAFPPMLDLPERALIVSKAATRNDDAESGFSGTDLAGQLEAMAVSRLFVGGLGLGGCVRATVADALIRGFEVLLLEDAVCPGHKEEEQAALAIRALIRAGAQPVALERVAA